ncbi:phage tail tip lysozyme [Lactococcus carnosus]|uniref:phage tail tip lysozyme n=1 Tax=Pseudolactococcus carnosus TaxID=2749961 RepID=UPI0015DCC8EA|nr:phage tail tip lysozyme [Lactococcus carnosus]MCJ1987407.1 CHAP domain-containing protein [Lactococcus carnosus]MCJ2004689.1 CHAP domain-containing protein [Lactococcus carnosus]QDJ26667.1 hypothetical protein BHS00_08975 [Lactococcus carnosus]
MANYTRKKSDDKVQVVGKKAQVFEQREQNIHVKRNATSQSNSNQVSPKKSITSGFANKKILERGESKTEDKSVEVKPRKQPYTRVRKEVTYSNVDSVKSSEVVKTVDESHSLFLAGSSQKTNSPFQKSVDQTSIKPLSHSLKFAKSSGNRFQKPSYRVKRASMQAIETHRLTKQNISNLAYKSRRDGRIESKVAYKVAKSDVKQAKKTYTRVRKDPNYSIVDETLQKRTFIKAKQNKKVALKTKKQAIRRSGGTIRGNVAKTIAYESKNDLRTRLESAVVDDDMLSDLATARQKIRHTKGNVQTAKSAAKYTGKVTRWLGGRGYGLGNRTYNKFKGYGFKRTPKAMSIPHLAADSIRKRLVRLKRSKTGKVTGRTVKVLKILSNPFVNFLKNPLGLTGLLSLGFGVILIAIITSVVAMFSTTSQSDFDLSDSWKLMTYYDREKSTDKADYYTQLDDVMIYANAKNDDYQPTAPHKFKVKKGDWLSKNGTYGDWLESLWDKLDGNPDNLKVPADIYSDDKESNDFTFDKAELTDFKERLEAVTEDGGGKYPQLLELENPLYLSNDTNNYNAPLKVIKRFGYASKDKMFDGTTIQANQGQAIYAALDGKIELDKNGSTVRIYGDKKTYLSMINLTNIKVKENQEVKAGTLIGYLSEPNLTVYYRKYRAADELPPVDQSGIWNKLNIKQGWTYVNPGFYFAKVIYLQNTSVMTDISSDATKKAKQIAEMIRKHEPKATDEGISAFLGNWFVESGINPKRAEGDYLNPPVGASASSWDDEAWLQMGGPAIYNGGYPNIIHRGLGLGQWTDTSDGGIRHTLLLDFARSKNKKWYDLELQVDFMMNGDDTGHRAAARAILLEKESPSSLAGDVQKFWEGNVGDKTKERADAAEQMYKALKSSDGGGGSTANIPAGYEDKVSPKPTGSIALGNAYPFGQCTWGAFNRLKEFGKNRVSTYEGNGGVWWQTAQSKGIPVHKGNPQNHEAVSFPPGVAGADPTYGHVAVVEYVNADGSFLISETNADGKANGSRTWRIISASAAMNCYFIDYS